MKSIVTIILLVAAIQLSAQDKGELKNIMKSALHIHDTASVYASSLQAAKMLEKAGETYKDEWMPNYWATYVYTQLGLYKDRPKNAGDIIPVKALENIEKAKKRYTGSDSLILSDIHSLKTFVYYIHTWYPEYAEKRDEYVNKVSAERKISLAYNMDNPMIYVLIGTGMVRSDKLTDVVAGRALLYQASHIFNQKEAAHKAQSTYWNEEWLHFFWLDNADNLLSKALSN